MDFFRKSSKVKLRSRHGKYLCAEEDECNVSQTKEGSKPNVFWTVEFEDNDSSIVKLKSYYNCYLTATNVPFLLGWTGKKVLQMKLVDSESSMIWEPIRDGYSVKLRSRSDSYLRANGSIPPWRNSITHDTSTRQDWFFWEIVPVGEGHVDNGGISKNTSLASNTSIPHLASGASLSQESSFSSKHSFKEPPPLPTPQQSPAPTPKPSPAPTPQQSPAPAPQQSPLPTPKPDGRMIYYAVADDDDEIPDEFDSEFLFKVHDVKMLTDKLKEEAGINEDIYVCAKNHITNKLFPLVLQLPPQNAPMYVVVVRASSKLARKLPGVGAESEEDSDYSYSRSSSLDYE